MTCGRPTSLKQIFINAMFLSHSEDVDPDAVRGMEEMFSLNLDYPKDLRHTSEFIQKVIMEMDGKKISTKVQIVKNRLHE